MTESYHPKLLPTATAASAALYSIALECVEGSAEWFGRGDLNTSNLVHHALGLAGEVGEVANIIKKIDRGSTSLPEVYDHLTEEVIDVFVYVMNLVGILDIDITKEYDKKRAVNVQRFGGEKQ
jgi:NTP pyrophosphatase (non-canonical NTP hydrolase)